MNDMNEYMNDMNEYMNTWMKYYIHEVLHYTTHSIQKKSFDELAFSSTDNNQDSCNQCQQQYNSAVVAVSHLAFSESCTLC